jgi:DNA polymerase
MPRRPDKTPPSSDTQPGDGEEPVAQPGQKPRKLADCRRCTLWHGATQGVPGRGPRGATIMVLGEQPGDQEDRAGEPFVGPAGALLDRALAESGVRREQVFVTNAVKHFKWIPRGKRRMHKTPAQREVMACHYWLEKELASVRPRVVVALGATALRALLQRADARLTAMLGHPVQVGDLVVVPTYHPSFVLRAPDPQARELAYATLVDALRQAARIAAKDLEKPSSA